MHILRNRFLHFAVLNTDLAVAPLSPGFAGDIGALVVWLIDWLIDIWTSGLTGQHLGTYTDVTCAFVI